MIKPTEQWGTGGSRAMGVAGVGARPGLRVARFALCGAEPVRDILWRYLLINKLVYIAIASYILTLVIIGQPLAIFSASSRLSALNIK